MMAYEFYLNDENGEPNLIGILPERRRDRLRITRESIVKWGRLVAGSYVDPNRIYYIQVELQKALQA
jgi:hypothetical protein